MVAGDQLDNDCDGIMDEEIFDGIDNDGDGKIDEDLELVLTAVVIMKGKPSVKANTPLGCMASPW